MEDDFKINMDIPRGHLIIVLLIIFLVGGFIIGFVAGGYLQDKRWKDYQELKEAYIDLNCQCYDNQEAILQWEQKE